MRVDVVDLSLREINPEESIARDDARSGVDPVNFTKAPSPSPDDVVDGDDNHLSDNHEGESVQEEQVHDSDD
jgi:hypothetical protein